MTDQTRGLDPTIDRGCIPNRDQRLDRLFDEHDGSHKNHCDLCLLVSLTVHFAAEMVKARLTDDDLEITHAQE